MDRLNLVNLHLYNPIEDDIKVVEITNFICENICSERHNEFKMFAEELIKGFYCCMANYNHVISLSNTFENIYEIFTEESFQILLDMDPNDSVREFGVFMQSIDSMKSEFDSKFEYLEDRFDEMISNKIYNIEGNMIKFGNNDEIVTHLKDLKLFNRIYGLLLRINYIFHFSEPSVFK